MKLSQIQKLKKKIICIITKDGKKAIAEKILFNTFFYLRKKTKKNPCTTFLKAIQNVKPLFELRLQRVSRKIHKIPKLISTTRQESIALRWIVQTARQEKRTNRKKKIPFSRVLALHLMDASKKKGPAFQKKISIYKTAESNRSYISKKTWQKTIN